MRLQTALSLALLGGLCACGRQQGLYADRSIAVAPPVSAATAPRFVGNWAPAGQCKSPWVIQARSLARQGLNCDFDKVETSSAGYAVASVCHANGGRPTPGRLSIVFPQPERALSMTISGGPFSDAVALQRCPA